MPSKRDVSTHCMCPRARQGKWYGLLIRRGGRQIQVRLDYPNNCSSHRRACAQLHEERQRKAIVGATEER